MEKVEGGVRRVNVENESEMDVHGQMIRIKRSKEFNQPPTFLFMRKFPPWEVWLGDHYWCRWRHFHR